MTATDPRPEPGLLLSVLRIVLLVTGVAACSSAVIMIKSGDTQPQLLAGYRLVFAVPFLIPLLIRSIRRGGRPTLRNVSRCVLPGIMLGLHFITWIIGARMTFAANSSLIVNMTPLAMPFFLIALTGEKLDRREILGTLLAVGGVFVLAGGDYRISARSVQGDAMCFLSMLVFTFYLALARRNRGPLSLGIYIPIVYLVGGIFCLATSIPFADPIRHYPLRECMLILGLIIIPTVIGHSILNYSMQVMRGQVVAVINLGQFIFAGLMAMFFLREVPPVTFLPACILVVAGAVVAIHPWANTPARTGRARPSE